ncbi:MAG: DegV family protein [Fusobacteriaceae bacterium]
MKLEIKFLNSVRLIKLLIAASRWLSKYSDVLNDLNVYPVPDGDTGTNMSMTLQAVENDLIKLNHEPKMDELVEIVSEAVLLGARGNSGTILSQILQGFLEGVRDKEEVTVDDVAKAFTMAKERAYAAVINPVEGTMLTVIRRVAEEAAKYDGPKDDFVLFLIHVKNVAGAAVEETPNMLPKLKEAGVVDAGGKGIFYILEGFEKSITDPEMLKDLERIVQSQAHRREKLDITVAAHIYEEIKFKYCTEFVIETGSFDLEEYKVKLMDMGDSMVCAQTAKKTKTHIHTNNPGQVLEIAMSFGNLSNIKIDNMEIQHKNTLLNPHDIEDQCGCEDHNHEENKYMFNHENENNISYFAIADNREIGNLFLGNGAAAVLIGGQTQNPSVADIEQGLNQIKGDKVIVLPNNKNIIGAAKLAADRSKKDVFVLETATMLEGNYILKNRKSSMEKVLRDKNRNYSIEITQAVRDTRVDSLEIKSGDYIALVNGKITDKNSELKGLIEELYSKYLTDKTLNVLAVIGKGSTEEANQSLKKAKEKVNYKEIVGGQENYPYYIYIEERDPELPEIAILTDSTSDLTPELMGDLDISIIPLKIKLEGDEYYRDGVDITKEEFWTKLTTGDVIPKTSQPSPAEFKEMYENLFEKGYKKIITILISSKLSGTQQAAKVAKGMMKEREKDISIVDSKSVTFGLGYQVLEAAKMARKGVNCEELLAWAEQFHTRSKIYFVVNDLTYLVKGGRLGKAAGMIGGFLNLKPILKLEDGEVTVAGKAFGERGAFKFMNKVIKSEAAEGSVKANIGWGGTQSEHDNAEKLYQEGKSMDRVEMLDRYNIGATIGSHSGPVYGLGIVQKIK